MRPPGLLALATGLLLAACAAPQRPVRASLYDFGAGRQAVAPAAAQLQPTIVLAQIEASNAFDGTALLYRLGYADEHQLRPYSQARWSAPPAQLIRQRIRERLGRDGPVVDFDEGAALARSGNRAPRLLRLELEEFSHVFDSPSRSWGVLRLRGTLFENTVAGYRLLAQRTVTAREPAPTPDAPGGVRALAAATDAAADEIRQWVAQAR